MRHITNSRTRLLIEKILDTVDVLKAWITQSWKISLVMVKGAYLLTERKRLFQQLGEILFYKIERGEIKNNELDPLVAQLQRLNKRIELEELRVRTARFGKRGGSTTTQTGPEENA